MIIIKMKREIDNYLTNILDSIDSAAIETIPVNGNKNSKRKKTLSMWNEIVCPFKENAQFWHAIWQSAGRAINTELHKNMKRTGNNYHYQVRKSKRSDKKVKAKKLLESCLNGKNDLFEERKENEK